MEGIKHTTKKQKPQCVNDNTLIYIFCRLNVFCCHELLHHCHQLWLIIFFLLTCRPFASGPCHRSALRSNAVCSVAECGPPHPITITALPVDCCIFWLVATSRQITPHVPPPHHGLIVVFWVGSSPPHAVAITLHILPPPLPVDC